MVHVEGRQSREMDMGVGVVQGSILSPILFNVYINDLPKALRGRHGGLYISGTKINSILYADDIVLVTSSAQQLQNMLGTCERHSRDHGYEFAPEMCEVVVPVHRRRSHSTVKLYGTPLKEVDRYKYLGLPFGAKGQDTGRMCEVSIAKGIRTTSLFYSIGCNDGGFSPAVCRRVLTSLVQPSMEYGMALVNLRKGEQVAVDKALLQILRKTLSMPTTASGSAILKVLGVQPMSFRASKLNAGFMARIYDAQPDTLTSKILSYALKCSGIEAATMELCRGLDGHHQLERGTHTCLDVVLNDERYIKM